MKNISNFFDNAWNWAVKSSADPSQVSSTIKWALTGCGTILTIAFGFNHLTFPISEWNGIIDQTITAVQDVLLTVSAIGTLIAAVRKLYLSFSGQNPVVGSFKKNA